MGSLMAGWISEQARKGLGRKGSFTADEIENFWRLRKAQVDEHEAHLATQMQSVKESETPKTTEVVIASEVPSNPFSASDPDNLTAEEKKARVKDWWTRSNWAFLNAPPEEGKNELKGGTYTAQYDVASQASVGDSFGITAN